MNESEAAPVGAYMQLSNSEKSELIFKDIKNSYTFWQIKKAIKEEVVKSKSGKYTDLAESIPKILHELNLETKIKNKVHEILDKNQYFKETQAITSTKFKNCSDVTALPPYFFDQEFEPLESVASTRRIWNETLKSRMNNVIRASRKPFLRPKKLQVKKKN